MVSYRPSRISEDRLQSAILDCAKLFGWLRYHTHDSRRSHCGFPDLTLVRGARIVFAELKSDTGKVTRAQRDWIDALAATGVVETYVWWPKDWTDGTIEEVLR